MKDRDILLTAEHPEADVKHIVRGIVRSGLKAVPPKRSVSLRNVATMHFCIDLRFSGMDVK